MIAVIWTVLGWLGAKKWLLIGGAIAVVVIVAGIWIGLLTIQRDRARAEAAEHAADAAIYQVAAERNAETIRAMEAAAARLRAAGAAELAAANRRTTEMADIAAEIIHVQGPNEACGPRVRLVLERLRGQAASDDH